MALKYTLNELLVIVAAREIEDHARVILGVGMPTIAGALAKGLHAPNATLMMESGIIDFLPLVPPNHIADANCCRGYGYSTDLFSTFTMTYRGYVDVCFLGVAQVDRFGNLNTTVVGDYDNPEMRLPGSGGAADFISYAKKTILTMRGGEFVNELDYLTSPGYLTGGDSREASGLFPEGSGPTMLISPKGIFRFDETTKELYLAQIFPGVDVEEIKQEIPWELKVSPTLSEVEPPTREELAFIRYFAPSESLGKATTIELTINEFFRDLQALKN
ncbi:3-oxoadipate--succinyl-CoA transferase subunit B [Desulfoluna limicola]|uniref:3-oxoadipate--succinyl-CoA transferase subunit B n=1 Tax=Desulfoluna limicola TaxID=2810562 RepID=A0ABN6F4T7_9BACT|nr:CoA-transferase [Desulfoluna limicola]BCS96616.1 3-oxoadipate--succinyl-CoA transferase subunit B [Desulfoluna limicola]